MKKVSPLGLADVARRAGVSTATASRALSRPESVSERRRTLVSAAVAELGYMPNGPARALALQRTFTIGCVLPTLDHAIFAQTAFALQKHLAGHGYSLLLSCHEFDAASEARMVRTFVERGVDGLVLVGIEHDPALLALLEARRVPCVFTWAYGRRALADRQGAAPRVGFDNRAAGALAARHLLDLGHRDIAIVAGARTRSERHDERVRGIVDALARAGAAPGAGRIIDGPIDYATGRMAVCAAHDSGCLPTAYICSNDVIAAGAIAECAERGLAVPRDISIVGFEDLEIASNVVPRLTTIRFPTRDLGLQAGIALVRLLSGAPVAAQCTLPVALIARESTARCTRTPAPAPIDRRDRRQVFSGNRG